MVLIAAVVVAALASIVLAVVLARMLARPLADVGAAARRVAEGDYAARVPREGPEELASLADSFNQMAASLERQEAMRRDFIANAAHELRTPLTNLQGYLEALRDGVIVADRATYESLWEEAERLVRLSRSLDALAEGDAADGPPELVDLDLAAAVRTALDLAAAEPRACRTARSSPRSPSTCPARANPDQLAQVLANLLSNAARYTPAGGTVTVRAERRPGRPARLGHEHRRGHPARGPRSRLRALLPRREVARPRARRRRHRARHRQAARRGGRRPRRRRVGRRPDARSGSASRPDGAARQDGRPIATIPTAIPASPNHWIGLRRSPRNATATTIVTAGPNDAASPTIHVGAVSRPIANEIRPTTSRTPASTMRGRRPAPATTPGPPGGRRPDAGSSSTARIATTADDRDRGIDARAPRV